MYIPPPPLFPYCKKKNENPKLKTVEQPRKGIPRSEPKHLWKTSARGVQATVENRERHFAVIRR